MELHEATESPGSVEALGLTERPELRQAWEDQAESWIAWARRPGHDTYWRFHRRHLLGLLPAPGRLTLDVGCGEGRVSRDLALVGHRVVGLDLSGPMLEAAAGHSQAAPVILADGATLPVSSGSVDLVVAFMSAQDMAEPGAFIAEAHRVLEPGGRLYFAIVHPMNSGGQFEDTDRETRFVLRGSYFQQRQNIDDVVRRGLAMRFVSEHRPMEQYWRWLERAGFVVERFRESPSPEPDHWQNMPLFAHLCAVKLPLSAPVDRRLFHIASPSDVEQLRANGVHEPSSLGSEGFVHCSTAAQVVSSTERHFEPDADLVLIELDPELVESDVRWPEVYPGQRFPHLHGPLTAASMVAVHPWGAEDRRRWHMPGRVWVGERLADGRIGSPLQRGVEQSGSSSGS